MLSLFQQSTVDTCMIALSPVKGKSLCTPQKPT